MPFSLPDPITSDPWHRHLYAIGLITLLWNRIEDHVDYLLKTIGGPVQGLSDLVVGKLGNVTKMHIILEAARSEWEPEGLAQLEHFFRAFNICRQNRNIILHSRYAPDDAGEPVMTKISDKGVARTFSSDLAELTRIAGEMDVALWHIHAIIQVGGTRDRTWRSLHASFPDRFLPLPWPEIPPLPRKLDPLPPQEDQPDG
ncbi:MAG TPA: hypothetical protein VNK52_04020 [Hyphomicrobiaceae bacterium]|nr:hypothetical protein [Hyphomicrobiaceae bacterium]